ncbi:hypothetical protein BB560_006966 [Smittium megazygosporum]|uniref:VWFA domain-containing protein n=1 Tax=Smittium megazygosporum TaxID=133381 RepID=A0A2T9XZU8_9FUNG|nr:hypothetical protein BB560_006966 [Smittium megazygosporum]
MVLEATVLIVDNSEWNRNGDFTPNRFQAQIDAIHYLFKLKTQNNPENTVSVLSSAGDSPHVLVTLTNDSGIFLKGIHELKIEGKNNFITSIQIAQLILKHRANKNQRQRIMIFTGSPVTEDEKILTKLAKKLKKNNVSVDVIDICEVPENEYKLREFVTTIDATGGSNKLLSESLRGMIMQSESGGAGGEGNFDDEMGFGIDPNLDPELALALRMSLEEELARQRAAEGSNAQQSSAQPHAGEGTSNPSNSNDVQMDEFDEEEQIRRAIELSLMDNDNDNSQSKAQEPSAENNQEIMSSLLGSLSGVDVDDPQLKKALEDLKNNEDNKDDNNKQ